jgi:hypothetical protein
MKYFLTGGYAQLLSAAMNVPYHIMIFVAGLFATSSVMAQETAKSPAIGYNIHILAPHRHEDGTVHGPYHHYCKVINPEVMQCMIFLSTDPDAELVEVEYFIDKKLVRENVTLEQWNRHYHDHAAEVASGNVQVLDTTPQQAKEIAAAASKTDGIIFHMWSMGSKVPNGDVTFPTAISHKPVAKLVIPD